MTTPTATTNELKLCIFGGRDFTDYDRMEKHVEMVLKVLEADGRTLAIVSGMARGADRTAFLLAKDMGLKVYEFPADWKPNGVYDPVAGFKRNMIMAVFSDEAMGYWNGISGGTRHMQAQMKTLGKPCAIHRY